MNQKAAGTAAADSKVRRASGESASGRRRDELAEECARILEVLRRTVRPEKVLVFGSLAGGRPVGEASDIDLLVVYRTELPFLDRLKELYLVTRPTLATDFLALTPEEWEERSSSDPFLRDEVLGRGKVLFDAG